MKPHFITIRNQVLHYFLAKYLKTYSINQEYNWNSSIFASNKMLYIKQTQIFQNSVMCHTTEQYLYIPYRVSNIMSVSLLSVVN